jgi:hypothetical protein
MRSTDVRDWLLFFLLFWPGSLQNVSARNEQAQAECFGNNLHPNFNHPQWKGPTAPTLMSSKHQMALVIPRCVYTLLCQCTREGVASILFSG